MTPVRIEDLDLQGIRCVVFDLDGTLYNKRWLGWRLVFGDFPYVLHLAAERIVRKQMLGKYMGNKRHFYDELFRRIANWRMISIKKAEAWYYNRYMPLTIRILRKHYKADDFVFKLLKQLKEKNIKTAVFSDYGYTTEKLKAIGLHPNMFDYIFSSPDLGGLKPNKETFMHLLETMHVQPNEALMIGDRTDCDGKGASNVGMRFYKV